MEISFKEVVLKRISFSDVELLRQWRNSRLVSDFMFFQEEITKEMQNEWFHSLQSENDFYFLIYYRQVAIGLINLKNIDWTTKQGEAGLYISIEKYRKTPLAIYASLALLKFFFEEKGLVKVFASVKTDNVNTIKYNQSLGFEKVEEEKYELSNDRYNSFTKKIYKRLNL